MSILSNIFKCYKESLDHSLGLYEDSYKTTAENGKKFYNDFLKDYIIDFESQFSNPHSLNKINEKMRDYFQKDDIQFVAIDGTCSADPFNDFMVFFAAAYGVRGKIQMQTQPPKMSYERWSMDQDVSLVAYVPIPYAQAGDITDSAFENFIVDDTSKINLSSVHTRLMQLAEIYLAYEMARSPTLTCPKLILMDLSLSSVMMSTDGYIEKTRLFGHPIGTRVLQVSDGLVVFAHPFNQKLGVPTAKKYRRWGYLVRYFSKNRGKTITIQELSKFSGESIDNWERTLHESFAKKLFQVDGSVISAKFDFSASWFDSVRFFEEFCDRLFHKREADALIYPVIDEIGERSRWMSPEDISFLISIGIRALIEQCWDKNIMLLGISKDSSSQYFSKNFIGVLRECDKFPAIQVGYLPWTDRSLLECLAYQLENLKAPWAITEFDSVYMSLHVETEQGEKIIRGNRGNLVNQERIFARSLCQFFKIETKSKQLMGHVIFLDRLMDSVLDQKFLDLADNPIISNPELGIIRPAFFGSNNSSNSGQTIAMWLLKILTRNLFPEVIGYPDPLHKADWGAKSLKRKVDGLIKSSEITFRTKPLARTFRDIRDSARR